MRPRRVDGTIARHEGGKAVFQSSKRRQRQVVRFVDLVVGDALHAPTVVLADARPRTSRTRPVYIADGGIVCGACLVADSPFLRMRGLLGRRELGADEGVLLRPAGSIHTFFMRFAIDAIFLDREGRVLRIADAVGPWHAAAARGARAVLELRAGEAARRGVAVGDVLVVGGAG
jgi:uncharacterized membrane protein (UPF0127 family)